MQDPLNRSAFESHLNTTFHLLEEDGGTLELVAVEDKTPEGFPGEQFSLLFRGPLDAWLPQRTYPVEHPKMGRIDLFLVPVAEHKDGYRYEAFFNRSTLDDA